MHLLKAGVNVIYIRDLLGHADVSTTEIYARADAETKRKAIENAYESLTPEHLPNWTGRRVCTRNCVGTSERDRHVYDNEELTEQQCGVDAGSGAG